ncbi:winged helix-turn-helix domain-containing tetratricopeptide repeat protein [Thalassococcus lentus]|uniref:Winged helix-turn-helix domain-containing protein n=1 Tax=Thalassococcus lentus TaxID=1210524 RepID=A0ABT4XV08_9RHOB|nr:winged helix-turn-helix domain-containing protein [Thalassococcus lentus]MDA7425638.1 winged helix-turn-helix domain-containing protein [Thalassococcus lentus]
MPSDESATPGTANQQGQPNRPAYVRFGDVVYGAGTGQLTSSEGQHTYLRAQSALVLDILVEQLGQLVPKDDLIQRVWPDIIVTDASLTQCIRDIRLALGDTDRKILMTVPKQGFRLFGALLPQDQAAEFWAEVDLKIPLPTVPARAAGAGAEPGKIVPKLDPRDVLPTLAVLPFKGIATQTVDVFGFFLADEVSRLLSLGNDVNVISRMSTGTLGGEPLALSDVHSKLNADFVLSGFLAPHGDQVAVSLEFAETETGYVLWAERMQIPFDPINPSTEGLDLVAANIRRAIMANEVRRVHSRPIGDLKLFSILHGAVGLMHRLSPDDFRRAKGYLELLHEKVPQHPAPLAWMARWHALNAVQGWAHDPRRESEAALEHTARALDLDPNHTLALVCEGQVLVHLSQDLDAAEERYDQALKNNPNDANGRSLRGMLRGFTDRGSDAKRDTERALHLTPLDPHRFMYLTLAAGACLADEDYERALALTKESLRLNRAHMSARRMLPVAYLGTGKEKAAQKAAEELLTLQPDFRVSDWLRSSPSADFKNGMRFAEMLTSLGVPD